MTATLMTLGPGGDRSAIEVLGFVPPAAALVVLPTPVGGSGSGDVDTGEGLMAALSHDKTTRGRGTDGWGSRERSDRRGGFVSVCVGS